MYMEGLSRRHRLRPLCLKHIRNIAAYRFDRIIIIICSICKKGISTIRILHCRCSPFSQKILLTLFFDIFSSLLLLLPAAGLWIHIFTKDTQSKHVSQMDISAKRAQNSPKTFLFGWRERENSLFFCRKAKQTFECDYKQSNRRTNWKTLFR